MTWRQGRQVRPAARGVGGLEDRAVVVGGARVGEFLLVAPPHGAADAPQRPDVGARRSRRRRPGWPSAHGADPCVDLQRQRAGAGAQAVTDILDRFDLPAFWIADRYACRPQPFDEYFGHARAVAIPGALQVPEGVST